AAVERRRVRRAARARDAGADDGSRAPVDRADARGAGARGRVLPAPVRQRRAAMAGVVQAALLRGAAGVRRLVADAVRAGAARDRAAAPVVERPALVLGEVAALLGGARRAADAVRVAYLTGGAVAAMDRGLGAATRDVAARSPEGDALVGSLVGIAVVRDSADAAALAALAAEPGHVVAVDDAAAPVRDEAARHAARGLRRSADGRRRPRSAARLAVVKYRVARTRAAVRVGRATPAVRVVALRVRPAPEPREAALVPDLGAGAGLAVFAR